MCVCVCVFARKFEYVVVYENVALSDQGQGHCRRSKFSPFTTIQTVKSYISTLVRARNLILGMYVHLLLIYKMYKYRHA